MPIAAYNYIILKTKQNPQPSRHLKGKIPSPLFASPLYQLWFQITKGDGWVIGCLGSAYKKSIYAFTLLFHVWKHALACI